jgi:hypothetical protein
MDGVAGRVSFGGRGVMEITAGVSCCRAWSTVSVAARVLAGRASASRRRCSSSCWAASREMACCRNAVCPVP